MNKAELPTRRELAWPTLKVLKSLGGPASINQIHRRLAEALPIPSELLQTPHVGGRQTQIEYETGWALTSLKKVGAVENPSRSIWRITNLGRGAQDERTLLDAIKNGTRLPGSPPPRPIDPDELPTINELAWPTLNVLKDLGGTASIKQISSSIAQELRIPRELRKLRSPGGELSEFRYRALCARIALKSISALVENASNGMWSITDSGRRIPDEDALLRMLGMNEISPTRDREIWRDELLGALRTMKPTSFIALCTSVLVESGFRQIEVVKKTGDGDMIGSGILVSIQ